MAKRGFLDGVESGRIRGWACDDREPGSPAKIDIVIDGAVVATMPVFAVVRDAVFGIGGGPLVSLAVATNILAALTGSASGGLTIALDALGATYLQRAAQIGKHERRERQ